MLLFEATKNYQILCPLRLHSARSSKLIGRSRAPEGLSLFRFPAIVRRCWEILIDPAAIEAPRPFPGCYYQVEGRFSAPRLGPLLISTTIANRFKPTERSAHGQISKNLSAHSRAASRLIQIGSDITIGLSGQPAVMAQYGANSAQNVLSPISPVTPSHHGSTASAGGLAPGPRPFSRRRHLKHDFRSWAARFSA